MFSSASGQRGFARGGGEGDQERLASRADKGAAAEFARSWPPRPAPRRRRSRAFRTTSGSACRVPAERPGPCCRWCPPWPRRRRGAPVHHVVGVAEHHLGERFAERHHGSGFGADGRAGRAEQKRKHDNLQHVAAGHGVDDAGGKGVLERARERGPRLRPIRVSPAERSSVMPSPGRTRFTAPNPRTSAMVVRTSK